MDIPESLYAEQLKQSSQRIAAFEDQSFEYLGINATGDEAREDAYPLSFTAVFMLPGQEGPKLKKTEFKDADTPAELVEGFEKHFADETNADFACLGFAGMRVAAESIGNARDEVEEGSASVLIPFKTVALSAIYNRANTIYQYNFIATDFLDALVAHFPDPPAAEELNEDVLQAIHANASEQATNPEPYQVWREFARTSLFNYKPDIHKRKLVQASVGVILLPQAATHPTIDRLLFQEQPLTFN